ncbi:MAG TPA: efflux RND transporter permease subunit [Vicinamibacteria bacterium]|nr:efflux RND transporter permease subunit [Vicinamibacteria bacterium]
MRLTDYSIHHRLTVYVLTVLIAVAGVTSYVSLPRESFPEVQIPLIFVYTVYPGVSPADIETLITRPIETEIKAISGIKEIRSTSAEGISTIQVEFNPEVDIDTAIQKVREKVDLAKPDLPPEAEDPRIQDVDVSQIPILIVGLSGQVGLVRLTDIAKDLKDDLEAIPGVNRVQIIGGKNREVHVYVDPRRLDFYELSLSDVVVSVARENLNVPGGEVEVGGLKYLVRLPAEVEDPQEIEDFVLEVRDGQPIYVRDLARVEYGFEEESTLSRVDQDASVTLTVEKRTGVNLIAVADEVKAELQRLEGTFPAGTVVTILGDQSKQIRLMVEELENNIISGLILVVAVLMAFLGFRNSAFVAVAIPLSMLISFVVVQALGYTLNMIVLFSLILVLGMLVDNAIVIVENIYRHREEGEDGVGAASRGTREVAMPVIASTITTLCAFAPMLIWPGIVGDFMSYLPITLMIGLTASLVVAFVFNPTLCAYFMPDPKRQVSTKTRREGTFMARYHRLLTWLLEPASDEGSRSWFLRNWALPLAFVSFALLGTFLALGAMLVETQSPTIFAVVGALMGLGAGFFLLQGIIWLLWSLARRAARSLPPYVTDRRSGTIWVMGALLAFTFVAYAFLGQGVEFFPEIEPRQILVDVEAPSGATLETSNAIVREIESRTMDTKDAVHLVANVGSKGISIEGGDALGGGSGGVSNTSRITLDLLDREFRQQSSFVTLNEVREAVSNLAGAEIKVDKPAEGPQVGKAVTIRVIGDDFRVLARLAQDIKERIRGVPGLVNLDDDLDRGKPELRVHVDRIEAMLAGVSTEDIATTVQTAVRGTDASKYRIGEDEYDIVVRLAPEARRSLDDVSNLTVPDEDGVPIPMRSVVRLEPGVGPAAIQRVDLKRVVTVDGDVVRAQGRTEDSVRQEVAERLQEIEFPSGYRWTFAGSNQEEAESQAFLQRAFVIAVLLIVLVLVTQFDSLVLPFTIMVSVVLSLIGVLWGLIVTATPFGIIMTGIGVISLAGIVVNNAIVLCDFIQQLRAGGVEKTEAVIRAGMIRLRPVLLTAVTTILGLVPLTMGINLDFFKRTLTIGGETSQWWGPMGVAVIFGLTVATVLTLVVVPVTYHSLDSLSTALAGLPEKRRAKERSGAVAESAV